MSKYLEVTIRIPIREQYQEEPKVINHIAGATEVCHIEGLEIEAGITFSDDFYEQVQDSPLISSLAHLKSVEVVEIDPLEQSWAFELEEEVHVDVPEHWGLPEDTVFVVDQRFIEDEGPDAAQLYRLRLKEDNGQRYEAWAMMMTSISGDSQ